MPINLIIVPFLTISSQLFNFFLIYILSAQIFIIKPIDQFDKYYHFDKEAIKLIIILIKTYHF